MKSQIYIGIIGLLIQLLISSEVVYARTPDSVLLMAKRYMMYHSTFPSGTDFYRLNYHALNEKVKGEKPVIMDSIMIDQSLFVSKHIAYSTHTGMTIQQYGRLIRIIELDKNTIAYVSGLRQDDLIRSINGVYPAHLLHAWQLLQSGKIIEIETINNGLKKLTKVRSKNYPLNSIIIRNHEGNTYIDVKTFQSSIVDEYDSLISTLQLSQYDTVIIDIRKTIGLGDLKSVIEMASTFIPDETDILKMTVGSSEHTFTSIAKKNFAYPNIRVMIDTNTEGHALLFAGLLYHFANAELSGTRSSINGKLTLLMPLEKSSTYYLSFPIVHYEIGDQYVLHERGLETGKLNDQRSEYTLK
jgi:C-terminal processing protease CtpA/Prc